MNLPCTTEDLKPQKGKMDLKSLLIKADLNDGQGEAIISEDNIFLTDKNVLPNCVLIEYVNQLVAAIQGYREKYQNMKPLRGLFVGVQEVDFINEVYSGDRIFIRGSVIQDIANIKFIKGIIEKENTKIAEIVTKIFEIENIEEFDRLIEKNQPISEKEINFNVKSPPEYLDSNIKRKFYSYIKNITVDKDSISLSFSCPSDFDPFDGHFYDNPILPGIMLIEIVDIALRLFYERATTIKSIKKMKIGGVITPYKKVNLNLKVNSVDSLCSFFAEFYEENGDEISRFNGTALI